MARKPKEEIAPPEVKTEVPVEQPVKKPAPPSIPVLTPNPYK